MAKIRILIADDNQEFCEMFCRFCEKSDSVEVVGTVFDGEQALRAITSEQPDVVLLDIIMPQLDGLGVLERLQKIKLNKRPKMIIVSALSRDKITQRAIELGAIYYFIKPYSYPLILQRVEELCAMEDQMTPQLFSRDGGVMSPQERIETTVISAMQRIGIPPNLRGYVYLREAIIMVIRDLSLLNAVTKRLYPDIATQFETMPSRVERAIRHAIEVAWTRGDIDVIQEYFGYTISSDRGKPTNSEFIAMIADHVKLKVI